MKNLKVILQSNLFLFFLLFFTLFHTVSTHYFYQKPHQKNSNTLLGSVETFYKDKEKVKINLKEYHTNQKYIVFYYFKDNEDISYQIGDKLFFKGSFKIPDDNKTFYTFNYRKYLLTQNIEYIFNADEIKKIKSNQSILKFIKNKIIQRIENIDSKEYLYAFILGDNSYIDEDIRKSYQTNGISHLFAISGMHVSLFTLILLKLLKKVTKHSYIICSLFLLFYCFLTNFSPSVIRSSFLFIFLFINKKFDLQVSPLKWLCYIFCILLIYNPFYIYHIGFLFSFTISFTLILFSKKIEDCSSYITKLLMTSFMSFLASIPILLTNNYELNLCSILFNLFFVPFISYIIFPMSLLVFMFPFLDYIYSFLIYFMEYISLIFTNYSVILIYGKWSIVVISLYLIIMHYSLKHNKYLYLILFLFISYFFPYLQKYPEITFHDVSQGDSTLISFAHHKENILIDTGGIVSFNNKTYYVSDDVIVYLKAKGIRKINYLIITHGDYDHMGDAEHLIKCFKVEKVILNCGEYNDLEKELIKVLDKKKIKHYSCIKQLNIDNNKLYFLQTKEYNNENDNSNVIYTELNGYKFMFMGDASSTTEKEILNKYNLPNIDILKVGHHGSKTSSGKEFIDEINPKYSIISVGKNNRYGHPNREALYNLKDSKIYRTDEDGSIMFKIKHNKLKIETCSP